MEQRKELRYRLELPLDKAVKFGALPGLMAASMHSGGLAHAVAEDNIRSELVAMVDAGLLEVLSPSTLGRHPCPIGDELNRAVLLPVSLRPLMEARGIELRLVEPGNGPSHWSLENAASEIANQEGWHGKARDSLLDSMERAAWNGELTVKHPHTDLPYRPEVIRGWYELVTVSDVNAWLERLDAPYRWLTSEAASKESRIIGGRKLWRLLEAAEAVAKLPDFGVTVPDLMKSLAKAAAARELHFRDVRDGSPKWGDHLSSFLGEWLFGEDFNTWLSSAGFSERYRLVDSRESTAADAPAPTRGEANGRGMEHVSRHALSTDQVCEAFAGVGMDYVAWQHTLTKNRPAWIMSCRTSKGKQGATPIQATWCPLKVAEALVRGMRRRAGAVHVSELDAAFKRPLLRPAANAWAGLREDNPAWGD